MFAIDIKSHILTQTRDFGDNYDWEHNTGTLYRYFVYGAAVCNIRFIFGRVADASQCSEVEVDVLTGSHRVLRSDIVMDIGCSLNQGVDFGQIEGELWSC